MENINLSTLTPETFTSLPANLQALLKKAVRKQRVCSCGLLNATWTKKMKLAEAHTKEEHINYIKARAEQQKEKYPHIKVYLKKFCGKKDEDFGKGKFLKIVMEEFNKIAGKALAAKKGK